MLQVWNGPQMEGFYKTIVPSENTTLMLMYKEEKPLIVNNIVMSVCDTSHVTWFIISFSSCLFGDDTNTHKVAGKKINQLSISSLL